jgi:predicted transcriptional regulator
LQDQDATVAFKAMSNQSLLKSSNLTEARYRKIISRLIANYFVDIVAVSKQQTLYVTSYGILALQKSLEGVNG